MTTTTSAIGSGSQHFLRGNTLPVQHVIVVVQENRSFDNIFQGFPNANTQNYGLNHLGNQVPLQKVPMAQAWDPEHVHGTFVNEADYSPYTGVYKMDGWDMANGCNGNPNCKHTVYTYVQQSDVANYWTLAAQYAVGDETFQQNMGPSYTAHQYLIAGQAGGYQGAHATLYGDPKKTASCAAPNNLGTIRMLSNYPGKPGGIMSSCVTYPTILDELDTAGISWKYYARSMVGYWTAPTAVKSLYTNDLSKVIVPETNVLADIANHQLPQVAYVTPDDPFSDHPYLSLTNHGQDWVALITNGIGEDPYYWDNTVVLVTWDDWGGFYDHVPPPQAFNPFGGTPNPNEYGFRVPLIVVGAYVVAGKVDHTVRSTASILGFIETVFGLPSLGTLDTQSDNLTGLFNWSQAPLTYQPVTTHSWQP